MDIQQIKGLAQRQPFQPFAIVFDNGEVLMVENDTELLFPRSQPKLVIAFNDGRTWLFEAEAISALKQ
jgi:hypothetical protein